MSRYSLLLPYLLILLLIGSFQTNASHYEIPETNLERIEYRFDEDKDEYARFRGEGKLAYESQSKSSEKSLLTDTVNFDYTFYRSYSPRHKLIVLTPNIRGVTVLERRLAHYFAERGYHVLVPQADVNVSTVNAKTFKHIENIQLYALMMTNALIDHLHQKEDVTFDRNSIGLVGASLGGIRSAMLMGVDSRYKASFISVAGSDLPSIYANSQHEILKTMRARHMRYLGISSVQEYEKELRKHLTLDPTLITQSKHLDNVAMIIADDDSIVPSVNQWNLWNTINNAGVRPKTYQKDCTHVMGALWLIRYEKDALEWMNARL